MWWDARTSEAPVFALRSTSARAHLGRAALEPGAPAPSSRARFMGAPKRLSDAATRCSDAPRGKSSPRTVSRAAQQRPYSPSLYLLHLWWRGAPWRRSSLRCVTCLPAAEHRAALLLTPSPPFLRGAQPFIEDVASFLKDKDVETAIRQLQDTYSRLQMQEARSEQTTCAPHAAELTRATRPQSRLLQQRVKLQNKLPEIQRALECVKLLLTKQVCPAADAPPRLHCVETSTSRAGIRRGHIHRFPARGHRVCKGGLRYSLSFHSRAAFDVTARDVPT